MVAGVGGLHIPNVPEITGADTFEGPKFHSAQWDHTVDLKGKKVVVIGTGASAIQFIPIIAQEVGHLTVFQRTPAWVLPKKDKPTPEWRKKVFAKVPGAQRAYRNALYWALEARAIGFNGHVKILPVAEKIVKRYLAKKIPDPELRAKLTPDYRLGCKRVLQSNTYYPTFLRDNVTLSTDGVAEIVKDGVIDANGVKHEADIIIYGTGFHVIDAFDYLDVKGKGGVDLADAVPRARHRDLHGHDGPRLPQPLLHARPQHGARPQLGGLHDRAADEVHHQDARRDGQARCGRRRGDPEAQTEFNEEIQKLVEKGIWTQGGCTSWYLDSHGKNRTIWPKFTFQYWWETRKVEAKDFEWEKAA